MDELNDRSQSLVAQVAAGRVTEALPDTEEQLVSLARQGALTATHDENGWHFAVAEGQAVPESQPSVEPDQGEAVTEPVPASDEPTVTEPG